MKNLIKNIAYLIILVLPFQLYSQGAVTDSLDYYIAVAVENNPGTKAQLLAYEAYLQRVPQAGAYADPEFSGEFYPQPMDIIGGRSIANFGLSQQFSWFGTRESARIEAGYQADVQYQLYQSEMDNLILQVYLQWYDMQKLNEQIKNKREHKTYLDNLEELALIKHSSPTKESSSNMSEVLRIRLEKAELENSIESLKAFLNAEKARFNTLLNRDVNEPVNIGNEINKSPFAFDVEDVLKNIATNSPDLLMLEKEILAIQAKANKDKKMSYPTFGIGVNYMLIGKTDVDLFKMGNMNGRDMITPTLSISIPLFRKKYDAQQQESNLLRQAAEEKRINTLNNLTGDFYYLRNQLEDAERVIALYETQIELATTTYQLIVQEFVTGKSSLTNIIQVQRQLLDYQLKKVEAVASYNSMAISIDKLTSFSKN